MPNGQVQELTREELALSAVRKLKARGMRSEALDRLEEQLSIQLEPKMAVPTIGRPGEAPILEVGRVLRTGVRAGVATGLKTAEKFFGLIEDFAGLMRGIQAFDPERHPTYGPFEEYMREVHPTLPEGPSYSEAIEKAREIVDFTGTEEIAAEIASEVLVLGAAGEAAAVPVFRLVSPMTLRLGHKAIRMDNIAGLVSGAVAGGVSEPLRTAPVPETPRAGWRELDPMGALASGLVERGVPEPLALSVGGLAVGGVLGSAFDAVRAYRMRGMRAHVGDVLERAKRDRGVQLFIEEHTGGAPMERERLRDFLARRAATDLEEGTASVEIPEKMSKFLGEQMSREGQMLRGPALPAAEVGDNAVIDAVFRTNPDGISVARGVDPEEALKGVRALQEEGATLDVVRVKRADGTYDFLVSDRHVVEGMVDPKIMELNNRAKAATGTIPTDEFAENASVAFFLTPDGDFVPVGMPGVGLREETHFGLARAALEGAGLRVSEYQLLMADRVIGDKLGWIRGWHLPFLGRRGVGLGLEVFRKPTQAQLEALSRLPGFRRRFITSVSLDVTNPESGVRLSSQTISTPTGTPAGMVSAMKGVGVKPLAGQRVVSPLRDPSGKISARIQAQYAKEGAFDGQAVLLGKTGTPAEYVRREGDRIIVRSPLFRGTRSVPEENVHLLDYSYGNIEGTDDLIVNSLPKVERAAYERLRVGMARIEAERAVPKEFRDLEELAARTAGVEVISEPGGAIRVIDFNSSEAMLFMDEGATLEWMRNYRPMPPDLTPNDIKELSKEMGAAIGMWGHGGFGGPPPKAGDFMSLPEDDLLRTFWGEGIVGRNVVPTRGHLLDVQRQVLRNTGLRIPLWESFDRVSVAHRKGRAFENRWYRSGKGLPKGVLPLEKIRRIAGLGRARAERITDWLENEYTPAKRALIEAGMDSREIRAAKELRKWYNAMFAEFGLDWDKFLVEYAPHVRMHADKYANHVQKLWAETMGDIPLPRELRFFAEEYRYGTLRIYEKNAWQSAARYLRGGANKMFMGEPWKRAYALVNSIPNKGVSQPLKFYLEAVRGVEWTDQRRAINATFKGILSNVPGIRGTTTLREFDSLVDAYTMSVLGMGYQATMAFRLGLAVRNLTQTLQTTWTLLGTQPGAWTRGLARALTPSGVDEAVRAGAITKQALPIFSGEEILRETPLTLRRMTELGLKLYTGADQLNRSIAFHTQRIIAEDAIRDFAVRTARATSADDLRKARTALLRDSRAIVYDQPVIDEFLRRVGSDPTDAARFIGRQAADVTQYLYGRGNQPRWMRSVFGRFLGQFGTWPMWYVDFIRRTTRNLWTNAGPAEALRFLGRLAIANGAILYAGKEVLNIDLGRWAALGSVFYTGGPAAEFLVGLARAGSGLGPLLTGGEETYAKRRILEGTSTMKRVGNAFIPFHYAIRDAAAIAETIQRGDPTEIGAAVLGVRPTREWLASREADAIMIFLQTPEGELPLPEPAPEPSLLRRPQFPRLPKP